jgi:DNA segregation ATPase FtsK/SpoIIIE, S-DNA-T family
MGKKNKKKTIEKNSKTKRVFLPEETKKWILGILIFILSIIVTLSFFGMAGIAGNAIIRSLEFLIGKTTFAIPFVLILGGLVFLRAKYKKFLFPAILAIIILVLGTAGFLESFNFEKRIGGWLGYLLSWPFLKLFGKLVSEIVFGGMSLIGLLIFWYLIRNPKEVKEKESSLEKEHLEIKDKKPSLIKKIFLPKFEIKEIEPRPVEKEPIYQEKEPVLELKDKKVIPDLTNGEYKIPPLDLLEKDKGKAAAGDISTNSTIIKKTLENFGVSIEMSEVNIGPTVTQYTFKPAEGIKLSRITALSNNLSLALASHPIRIEAPIPGKSLVGVEIPNKVRCQIRLRDLMSSSKFQESESNLMIALGKDVSGFSFYGDLARMPHLLVAGATGTGKTIFLNSLILSLLYKNSPDTLRLILADPKRVEFSAYKDLPHLLTPVIFDPQKTVNALKWLTLEMEKRFDILSSNGSRNIGAYNQKVLKQGEKVLPYIVLIIDELADLMAAKGREIEVGIVRLAQMARAVGIHLVVATQRPSVEVITGLIKANITSRVTFQVASQVDSRTVLDTAGAEKLLGAGDLLFISADVSRPKRVQGSYVSEQEVRKVVDFIKKQKNDLGDNLLENDLAEDLEKRLEEKLNDSEWSGEGSEERDPLYEEVKKTVVETRKASASFLQRRFRIGYARAARLLDMLEEAGVIGSGEGAKPREVYLSSDQSENNLFNENEEGEENGDWKKV